MLQADGVRVLLCDTDTFVDGTLKTKSSIKCDYFFVFWIRDVVPQPEAAGAKKHLNRDFWHHFEKKKTRGGGMLYFCFRISPCPQGEMYFSLMYLPALRPCA